MNFSIYGEVYRTDSYTIANKRREEKSEKKITTQRIWEKWK
jgi:hypothetical protein